MVVFMKEDILPLKKEFEKLCFDVFRFGKYTKSKVVRDRRIRAWTGCSATTIAKVWFLLNKYNKLSVYATEERLLWGLHLMKDYSADACNAARFGGVDEETFANWAWYFIELMENLEDKVTLWENRYNNDVGNDCLASIDCVDHKFKGRIMDNGRPDKRFWSYKKKIRGPALRYEVCVCIRSSDIVWISGPWLPGEKTDLMIFRTSGIKSMLEEHERLEADNIYRAESPEWCKCPCSMGSKSSQKKATKRVRSRHETINKRLKNFECLERQFRHSASKHGACFRAAAVCVQLAMEGGETMFDCRGYYDTMTDQQVLDMFGF